MRKILLSVLLTSVSFADVESDPFSAPNSEDYSMNDSTLDAPLAMGDSDELTKFDIDESQLTEMPQMEKQSAFNALTDSEIADLEGDASFDQPVKMKQSAVKKPKTKKTKHSVSNKRHRNKR